jgi:hypothetical protein
MFWSLAGFRCKVTSRYRKITGILAGSLALSNHRDTLVTGLALKYLSRISNSFFAYSQRIRQPFYFEV